MASRKPPHLTFTIERFLPHDRETCWRRARAIAAEVPLAPPLVETVLSEEPPWRQVIRVDGGPVPHHERTLSIVEDADDPAGARVCWSVWVELAALDEEPTPEAEAYAAALRAPMERLADAVAAG